MKKFAFIFVVLFGFALSLTAQEREVKLKIVQTSDVHGNYYPYNFITQKDWAGSLAAVFMLLYRKNGKFIKITLFCWTMVIFCRGSPLLIIIII